VGAAGEYEYEQELRRAHRGCLGTAGMDRNAAEARVA
jgi:hypothetical protein